MKRSFHGSRFYQSGVYPLFWAGSLASAFHIGLWFSPIVGWQKTESSPIHPSIEIELVAATMPPVEKERVMAQEARATESEVTHADSKEEVSTPVESKNSRALPTTDEVAGFFPSVISKPEPLYPRMARLRGWEGTVIVRVLVGASGRPQQTEILASSGYSVLDQSALDAIRRWKFQAPPRHLSQAGVWVEQSVHFQIR